MGTRAVTNRTTKGMVHDNMTNLEQAKMRGYKALHEYLHLPATITIYTGNVPFTNEVALFDVAYQNNLDLSGLTHSDNTGWSDNAIAARNAMAKKAAILGGLAKVKLEDGGHHELAVQCHEFEDWYKSGAFARCIKNAKDLRKLLNDSITAGLLTGYVVVTDLTGPAGLDALIQACEDQVGADTAVHEAEPVDTDKFKKSFRPADISRERFKNLSRFNDDFHAVIMKLAEVPTVSIQHTSVSVTVTDKFTHQPIEGAVATLSVADKPATSDYTGLIIFDQVMNGPDRLLKITAPNRIDVIMHIGINQGRDNHFDVGMVLGANPA